MNFEALNQIVENVLVENNKTSFSTLATNLLKKLKQGRNFSVFAPTEQEAIQEALIYASIFKAPQAFEGSPRVLWITSTPEKAKSIVKEINSLIKRTEIAAELADDKGKMIEQRNHIFEGADIIVGNPKRLHDLYNQNGFHVNQLKLVILDDLEVFSTSPTTLQHIRRVNESLPNCQKVIIYSKTHHRIEPFIEEICSFYDALELSDLQ